MKYCDERVCLSVCPLACLNKSSAVAEMGDRLAIIDMSRKGGGLEIAGSPSNTMWPGPRSTSVPSSDEVKTFFRYRDI